MLVNRDLTKFSLENQPITLNIIRDFPDDFEASFCWKADINHKKWYTTTAKGKTYFQTLLKVKQEIEILMLIDPNYFKDTGQYEK